MSFKINSVNIPVGKDSPQEYKKAISKYLRVNESEIKSFKPLRISLDARKKNDVKYTCSFEVELVNEKSFLAKTKLKDIQQVKPEKYDPFPDFKLSGIIKNTVIVGCGPAGLFCAYNLAKKGLKPILIERGEAVEDRIESVNRFWKEGKLNTSSNVQFGEGGAGTFSDGKLNTMIKDSTGRIREVFETFVEYGASPKILYLNKPHIGTDKLIGIVKGIREKIIELGGVVRFSTKLTDIFIENNTITGIEVNGNEKIACDNLVLAIGHSARDTFELLKEKGITMEQKPFAMGVRVQHNQNMINLSQYGEQFYKKLPAADYKLTVNLENGRGVYSFCMCPGGFVVNASSEEGRLAVNGMSNSDRSEKSANSAVVVTVGTADFPGEDCLAGMRLQRELEERAYKCCNGKVPVESYYTFVNDINIKEEFAKKCSELVDLDNEFAKKCCELVDLDNEFAKVYSELSDKENVFAVKNITSNFEKAAELFHMTAENLPNIKGQWSFGSIKEFLPDFIIDSLREAFPKFGKMIAGYDREDTLLIGLESRTSSPVRIVRGDNLQSVNIKGLYPCGEGAGYAGGITSAAVDGLKVFEAIISQYTN